MEYYDPPIKKFAPHLPRYEPKIADHSSIICAKRCKREYFLRIVLGYESKKKPAFFTFGSAYHKFREVLETSKADTTELKGAEALEAAVKLWNKEQGQNPPVDDKFSYLNLGRLIDSCKVAYKHWLLEKEKGRIEVLAVEQDFVIQMPDGSYTRGKADQIVKWNGKPWGRDFKTSSKNQQFYARSLEPNDQFSRYTYSEAKLTGTIVQGQIIEVLYNTKTQGPKIIEYLASRTQKQLEVWAQEQVFYNKILKLMRDEDCYPMEEVNCQYCKFHSVCKQPTEQAMLAKLQSEFVVKPWDPTNRDTDE